MSNNKTIKRPLSALRRQMVTTGRVLIGLLEMILERIKKKNRALEEFRRGSGSLGMRRVRGRRGGISGVLTASRKRNKIRMGRKKW